jgi:hypothetical protein
VEQSRRKLQEMQEQEMLLKQKRWWIGVDALIDSYQVFYERKQEMTSLPRMLPLFVLP